MLGANLLFGFFTGMILGLFFGLLILLIGVYKKRVDLGVSGLVSCVVFGFFFSYFAILPITAIFLYWIIKNKEFKAKEKPAAQTQPAKQTTNPQNNTRYTLKD